MATMTYDKELTAIQTWVKSVAGLPSWRLKEVPSKLPRPVVIWETPSRVKARTVSLYEYVVAVNQYGRLCVTSVDEGIALQDKLLTDLEEHLGVLPVIEDGTVIRKLRNARLNFEGQDTDTSLEGNFILSYEVTYYRNVPTPAPHATAVYNDVKTDLLTGGM